MNSTIAWYAATNASVSPKGESATISTTSASLNVNAFTLELELSEATELVLTDSQGKAFVKAGDYFKEVDSGTKEAVITVTPHFYKYAEADVADQAALSAGTFFTRSGADASHYVYTRDITFDAEETYYSRSTASGDELKGVGGGTYNFTITATGRTRIANNVTTFTEGTAGTGGYGYLLTIKGKVVLANAGTFTIQTFAYVGTDSTNGGTAIGGAQAAGSNISVKYSVGGDATDQKRSDNAEFGAATFDENAVVGGFGIAF